MMIAILTPEHVFSRLSDKSRVYYVEDVAVVLNPSIRPRFVISQEIDRSRIVSILSQIEIQGVTIDTWVIPEAFKSVPKAELTTTERYHLKVFLGKPNKDKEHMMRQAHWFINNNACLIAEISRDPTDVSENHRILRELRNFVLTDLPPHMKFAVASIISGNDNIIYDKTLISFTSEEITDRGYASTN